MGEKRENSQDNLREEGKNREGKRENDNFKNGNKRKGQFQKGREKKRILGEGGKGKKKTISSATEIQLHFCYIYACYIFLIIFSQFHVTFV